MEPCEAANSRVVFGPDESSIAVEATMPTSQSRIIIPPAAVQHMIREAALRYADHRAIAKAGLTTREWQHLFQALIQIESAFNVNAVSHVGAYGLGQLMPQTAADLGVDRHDPRANLDGAARYFLQMLDLFGRRELAIAAYNAGPQAVLRHGGIPPYRETQGHVRKVMATFLRSTRG